MKEVLVTPPLHFIASQQLKQHNPYDIKTWGSECGRGIPYADLGVKISTARKSRGKR